MPVWWNEVSKVSNETEENEQYSNESLKRMTQGFFGEQK